MNGVYKDMHDWLLPLFHFPLTTISALGLYAILLARAFSGPRSVIDTYLGTAPNAHPHTLAGFDAVRGLAALLIVLGHCIYFAAPVFTQLYFPIAQLARSASKAVPVFCVLSGFLIYRAVLAIKDRDGIRSYCIRRFLRVYPVYAVGVLLALFFDQYVSSPYSPETSASGRFFADLFMMRILWWPGFTNPVAWSLYHEILFYALLPLIVLTIGERRVALFAALGIGAMLLADYPSRDYGLYKYFLFGILASIYSDRIRLYAPFTFIVGAALIAVEFCGIDIIFNLGLTPASERWSGGFGLGLGVALALASLPHLGTIGRLLNTFPFRALGIISYSLYIIHPFVLHAVFPQIGLLVVTRDYAKFAEHGIVGPIWLMLVLIPAILFWAILCYLFAERPFIRLARTIAGRRTRGP